MAYIRKSDLRRFRTNRRLIKEANRNLFDSRQDASASVFLSHCHDDTEWVEDIRNLMANEGVGVYVDWLDPTMPSVTSGDTATKLKGKIRGCRKLVVIATVAARDSRWVPWELGFGDGAKGKSDIAVVPIAEDSGWWDGAEYLSIYPTLEPSETGYAVFPPGSNTGTKLDYWLRQT